MTEIKKVDPFSFPVRSACTDLPLSPSTYSLLSPPQTAFSHAPTTLFLLIPHSPVPSPIPSTASRETDSFDAGSLYSPYAAFPSARACGEEEEWNTTTKNSETSVNCDADGRPLQSRWYVSTFVSTTPPLSSASASSATLPFFPKLATVPSCLSARLKAAREHSLQHAREREEREKEKPQVILPYKFFPTPTPPSPKRKTNPGLGRYVPKPELMPQKVREAADTPVPQTSASSCGSPWISSETANTSLSPKNKGKGKECDSTSLIAQFARYRAHKHLAASLYASSLFTATLV